jgi:hypothetical protein
MNYRSHSGTTLLGKPFGATGLALLALFIFLTWPVVTTVTQFTVPILLQVAEEGALKVGGLVLFATGGMNAVFSITMVVIVGALLWQAGTLFCHRGAEMKSEPLSWRHFGPAYGILAAAFIWCAAEKADSLNRMQAPPPPVPEQMK